MLTLITKSYWLIFINFSLCHISSFYSRFQWSSASTNNIPVCLCLVDDILNSLFCIHVHFGACQIMWQSASASYHPRGKVCMLMQLCIDNLFLIGFTVMGSSIRFLYSVVHFSCFHGSVLLYSYSFYSFCCIILFHSFMIISTLSPTVHVIIS